MIHLGEDIANTFSFEVKERKLTHLRIEELQTSLVGSESANFPLSRV